MSDFMQIVGFIITNTWRAVGTLSDIVLVKAEDSVVFATNFTMLDIAIGMNAVYIIFYFAFGVRNGTIDSEPVKEKSKMKSWRGF